MAVRRIAPVRRGSLAGRCTGGGVRPAVLRTAQPALVRSGLEIGAGTVVTTRLVICPPG